MNGTAWQVTSETNTATGLKAWTRVAQIHVQSIRPKTKLIRSEENGAFIRIDAEATLTGMVRQGDTVEVLAREFPQASPVLRYYQIMETSAFAGAVRALLKEVSA